MQAAHRAGTKILGTMYVYSLMRKDADASSQKLTTWLRLRPTRIFEWKEAIPGLSQLLRGPGAEYLPLPGGGEGNDLFSPFYADLLITLAIERGLDGWLVNIEVPLELGFQCSAEQWPAWVRPYVRERERRRNARRLKAWVAYLRWAGIQRTARINAAIDAGERSGPKRSWHICWYDSVTYHDGQLRWQDALTELNRPFFLAADSLFTNYTWASPMLRPAMPGLLPLPSPTFTGPAAGGYHPALLCSLKVLGRQRPRSQIFAGIDVFGRNCYGGHNTFKSLDMIMPHRYRKDEAAKASASPVGMSVALFAPGWTWEHEEPGLGGRSWDAWWEEDVKFWRGHSAQGYHPPASSAAASHVSASASGSGSPLALYFPPHAVPTDLSRGFYTSFARGSGSIWVERGHKVLDLGGAPRPEKGDVGYTDVAATMPQPTALWSHVRRDAGDDGVPGNNVQITVQEEEGSVWAGNLGIKLTVRCAETEGAFVPLVDIKLRSGESNTSMLLVAVVKTSSSETTVTPALGGNTGHNRASADAGAGWQRVTSAVEWMPQQHAPSSRHRLGLHIRPARPGPTPTLLDVGAVALLPAATAELGAERTEEVPPEGLLRWEDFAPWTPFYELFAHAKGASPTPGDWLCSATSHGERGRTEYQFPTTWAGRHITIRPLL